MSQHPSEMEFNYSQPTQPKKGWFGRNWFWFLPTVILLPLLCCCGGPIGFFWFAVSKVSDLPPYKDSIVEAQQNAEVQAELGTPIPTPGLFEMMAAGGQINVRESGGVMVFDAVVPLNGANGSGTLLVEAESSDAGVTWTYKVREVTVGYSGEVIDLLPGGGGTTADLINTLKDAVEAVEDPLDAGERE